MMRPFTYPFRMFWLQIKSSSCHEMNFDTPSEGFRRSRNSVGIIRVSGKSKSSSARFFKGWFFLFVYKTQKTHTVYQAVMRFLPLSRHGDSNPGPFHYEWNALPTEPCRLVISGAKVRLIFIIPKIKALFFTGKHKKNTFHLFRTLFHRTKHAGFLFYVYLRIV